MAYINGKEIVFSMSGVDGESAYEIAVRNGFEGTEAEWLESLKGVVDYNAVFPVGTIIQSAVNKSPASFIGGTWERIKDKFILAAGDTYAADSAGGAATVTLTTDQMPAHSHQEMLSNGDWNFNAVYNKGGADTTNDGAAITDLNRSAKGGYAYVGYTGGGQAHNNMPPYIAKYTWQRIA